MQFRMRSGKEEYLRSAYDPARKRSVQKLVQQRDLTEDEWEQLRAWRRKTNAALLARAWDAQAAAAPESINDIAEALENGHTKLNEVALFEALDRLQKAMRKAGIKRPAKPLKPADDRTAPLDLRH